MEPDRRSQVLAYLFRDGPASRAAIADGLGIRRNTVGDVCSALMASGILEETDPDRTRNVPLQINPSLFLAVGVNHCPDRARVVVADLGLDVRAEKEVRFTDSEDSARSQLIGETVVDLLASEAVDRQRVTAIGFAGQGITDLDRGVAVRALAIPGWRDVPVCELLEQACGIRTWLFGYSDAMAALVLRDISDPEWDTALCALLDSALGLAIFKDGKPLRGNHAVFGEIGHIVMEPNGIPCVCGNRGCLETIGSVASIVRRVQQGIRQGADFPVDQNDVTMDAVIAGARAGNKLALHALNDAAIALGRGLGIAANLFGISKVLFLGKMLEAGDLFLEPIERVVRHDSIAPLSQDLTFRAGPLPSPDAAVGAAYLAFGRYFEGDLNIHPTNGGKP